jgi:hypothetical protein
MAAKRSSEEETTSMRSSYSSASLFHFAASSAYRRVLSSINPRMRGRASSATKSLGPIREPARRDRGGEGVTSTSMLVRDTCEEDAPGAEEELDAPSS